MKKLVLVFIGFIIFISCNENSNPVSPETPPNIPIRTLEAAPETLNVAGQTIVLSTYMWRDFMPISPPDGKPLIAIAYIHTTDSSDISDQIYSDAIYVINDKDVWKTYFTDEEPLDLQVPPKRLTRIARDGPKWETQIYVDVVVNVIYRGENYLLKAEDQFISETW